MTTTTPTVTAHARQFVYFADPMCSWCYGFAPVIAALERQFAGRMSVRLVMGGLRAYNTRAMRAEDKAYIEGAWSRVGAASGQAFDMSFFARENFLYDTEPACRAVVTVRQLAPAKALGFMAAIQSAFYGANCDITSTEVLAGLASAAGVDADTFTLAFLSAEMRRATAGDFEFTRSCGISGYPALLAGSEARGYLLVTSGFRPLAALAEPLEQWWASRPRDGLGVDASGET